MKFITESDLRDLYKNRPFTDYNLQEGERLTPGARQFLLDRGIDMYDKNDPFICGKADTTCKTEENTPVKKDKQKTAGEYSNRRLCARLKIIQTDFLITVEELLGRDVCLSQQLMSLYKHLSSIIDCAKEDNCKVSDLSCAACTGINEGNFSCNIGECFEITEFHMQVEKRREMLLLDRLRNELYELDIMLPELTSSELADIMSNKLNQIINSISQMICAAMGGKECQRKI